MYYKKRNYYSFESIEEVRNRIKDFSNYGLFSGKNLYTINVDENSFIVTQKYSLGFIDNIYDNEVLIEIKLSENSDRTKIEAVSRTNYLTYLIQIVLTGVFIFGLVNLFKDLDKALLYILPSIVMMLIIHFYYTFALRKIQRSFESSMDLI